MRKMIGAITAMLEPYPDRVNPGSLWGAANTAKKQT
jgi:hypothetical protein